MPKCKYIHIFSVAIVLSWFTLAESFWDFAVTTNEDIKFFDKNWTLQRTAAHQFNDLSALVFDEAKDVIYFSDHNSPSGSLFSLRLSEDDHYNYRIQELIKRQIDERIEGVSFDPVEDVLYWTDMKQQEVFRWQLKSTPAKILTFGDEVPKGISVDFCQKRLYWTNVNSEHPTIESASFEGAKHAKIVTEDLKNPTSVIVDSLEGRLYWVDVVAGSYFKIESSALDGSDRRILLKLPEKEPTSLAVDTNSIYFTDDVMKEVVKVDKFTGKTTVVSTFKSSQKLKGIIIRDDLSHTNASRCQAEIAKILERIQAEKDKNESNDYCLNGGSMDGSGCHCVPGFSGKRCERDQCAGFCLNSGTCLVKAAQPSCICPLGFEGAHCETSVCQNFCLNGGRCSVTDKGRPKCNSCNVGFAGDRCEKDVCNNYCHNGGVCDLHQGEPSCMCPLGFMGLQCQETVSKVDIVCKEICSDVELDQSLVPICEKCHESTSLSGALSTDNSTQCLYGGTSGYNKSLVFTSLGVMGSLALLFLIIITIYKIHKPMRPRIKKTYVVQKAISPAANGCLRTPATEQCEIIIENCCNMNICETPCFDPKMLQSKESNKKEDKKQLLSNMEGNGELF